MITPEKFLLALAESNINFVTGVPDSLLKDICAAISDKFPKSNHIIATNEGSAIALGIGHYLATSLPALVYMQNSGIGNAINPLTSLSDPLVFGIPTVLMIGWRGELFENGLQIKDEPQHTKQGQLTLGELDLLGIPLEIIDKNTTNEMIAPLLTSLTALSIKRKGPVALVVRTGSFEKYVKSTKVEELNTNFLSREEVISLIIELIPKKYPIVSTTGMASRELFEIRKSSDKKYYRDFLTVGGMGHASQIAAGIALSLPNTKIFCLDGDGALLMHMGALAISANCSNFFHIVINNGAHDSVGGQPTKGMDIDFVKIAAACGYKNTVIADTRDSIKNKIYLLLGAQGSCFLEIKCRTGARLDLGRPCNSPAQNKAEFMEFIQKNQ